MDVLDDDDAAQRAFDIRDDLAQAIASDGEELASSRGNGEAAVLVLATRTEGTPPSYESHMFNAYGSSAPPRAPARGHTRSRTELVAVVPNVPPPSNFTACRVRSETDLNAYGLAIEGTRANTFIPSQLGAAASRTETNLLTSAGMEVVPARNERSKFKAIKFMADIGGLLKKPFKGLKRKAEDDEDINIVTIKSRTKRPTAWRVDGERQLFATDFASPSTPLPSMSSPSSSFISPGSPFSSAGGPPHTLLDGPSDFSSSRISLSTHSYSTSNGSRAHTPVNPSILHRGHNRSTGTFGSFNSFPPPRTPTPGPDIQVPEGSVLATASDAVHPEQGNVTPYNLYYVGHKPGVDDASTRSRGQGSTAGSARVDPMKAAFVEEMEKHAKKHLDNPGLGSFGNSRCFDCKFLKYKSQLHNNDDDDDVEA